MAGATEVRAFQATVAPGTPETAPVTISLTMPTRTVDRIRWRIPPGWNGYVGFALSMAGQAFIPTIPGTWIIGSDEEDSLDLSDQPNSGAWEIQMYNTGIFPHTLYLQFTVELPDVPVAGADAQPVSVSAAAAPTTITAADVAANTSIPVGS